jgi:hypothetical protein
MFGFFLVKAGMMVSRQIFKSSLRQLSMVSFDLSLSHGVPHTGESQYN